MSYYKPPAPLESIIDALGGRSYVAETTLIPYWDLAKWMRGSCPRKKLYTLAESLNKEMRFQGIAYKSASTLPLENVWKVCIKTNCF